MLRRILPLGSVCGILCLCFLLSSWTLKRKGMVIVKINSPESIEAQMSLPNTVYEIRNDIDLHNGKLIVPAGSTLKFKGGRIMNGRVSFNNNKIVTDRDGVFLNVNARLDGAPVQNMVKIDWFSNSDNNDYDNWANAVSIARTLVLNRNKEYHFKSNTLGYNIVRRDLIIEGNHATIVLDPTYQLKGSDYCALIYHTKKLTVKNLNFTVLTSKIPKEGGHPGRKSIDLFYGKDPTGEEGDEIAASLENINIYVKFADSGLGTLYNAQRGTSFTLKKCNLYTDAANTLPGGGGLAWFLFDRAEHVSIRINNCYAEANGQDECIAINSLAMISTNMIIDANIKDCYFENKFDDGKGSNGAGLISMHPNTEQALLREGCSLIYNVTINNCMLKAVGAATNVARFYAAKRTSMNVVCKNSQFIYGGESLFDVKQMQNGMVLLTKDKLPPTPCSFLFKKCSFDGRYIMSCRYQYWENGEVTFDNCRFNCESFVCSTEFSKPRTTQEALFKKCDFHFNTDTIKIGFGIPIFDDCSFFCPTDSLCFPEKSIQKRPILRKSKLNGKRLVSN